jgi:ferric-dicitrate binding protein FerR (iron transport regulator)
VQANLNRLRAFGRRVADAQDEALRAEESLAEARARWLAPTRTGAHRASAFDWQLWGGVATAVTLAAAAVYLFFFHLPAPVLAFQVGPSEEAIAGAKAKAGVVGELVAAPAHGRLPVRFSDGSVVRLEPAAKARIVEVAENGSRLLLEGGVAHASVIHRGETRWSIQAGPFEVRVTGTQFDVGWEPSRDLFTLTLLEGRVVVTGCGMAEPRVVATGETFRATCENDALALTQVPPPIPALSPAPIATPAPLSATASLPSAPAPAPSAASSPSVARAPAAAISAPPEVVPPALATPPQPTWRELLSLHRYAEAFDVADAVGIGSICATADAETLMDLSDAARFAGHVDRAKLVLQSVRARFAQDERATTAAFNLGRIAFDDEADYAGAAKWFAVYGSERPQGPLAREAAGRRMEALERSGNHLAAREAALRYLNDFPAGPHTEIARSIADR